MKRRFIICLLAVVFCLAGHSIADQPFEIIRQGSKGESVVRIQERLIDLGYYTYKTTGSYQTVTRSAVVQYQAESGLMNDGTIGMESYETLFKRSAIRAPFRATISLTYTMPSTCVLRGTAQRWEIVKDNLIEGISYTIRSVVTGETVSLSFSGGDNHAEFSMPSPNGIANLQIWKTMQAWLGTTNSYYKYPVIIEIGDQNVAASIQWDADYSVHLFTTGSTSGIFNLPDPDHEAMIRMASGGN